MTDDDKKLEKVEDQGDEFFEALDEAVENYSADSRTDSHCNKTEAELERRLSLPLNQWDPAGEASSVTAGARDHLSAEKRKCPTSGVELRRDVRPAEISYGGRTETVMLPRWYPDPDAEGAESLHDADNMQVSDAAIERLKLEADLKVTEGSGNVFADLGLENAEELKAATERMIAEGIPADQIVSALQSITPNDGVMGEELYAHLLELYEIKEVISAEDMNAWIDSWDTENELPPPKPK